MAELEEKFMETFGIEPIVYCTLFDDECRELQPCSYQNCKEEKQRVLAYPNITDHILLELVCILVKHSFQHGYILFGENPEAIKEEVLQKCININFGIKSDVRKLFKE